MQLKFLLPDGGSLDVEATAGETIMSAAVANDVPGIIGECGGNCSCATCHVYVDELWAERLSAPSLAEKAMLEGALDRKDRSRLGCCIELSEELDGLTLTIPAAQV